MNCPHCQTEIDEHEANRCLDAWVAEAVFEYEVKYREAVPAGHDTWEYCLYAGDCRHDYGIGCFYSTNIAAAWEVHETQIGKLFSKRQEYLLALEEELREREKFTIAWPDALIFLSPLAICRAALKAVYVGEERKV